MPFTLVAWDESQDSAVLVNVAAVVDPIHFTSGDDIAVPGALTNLMGVYALGAGFTLGQLIAPSLRGLFNLDIEPADRAAEPASPPAFLDFFDRPIALVGTERMNFQAAEDTAGADRSIGLAWLGTVIEPVPGGRMSTVRVTNASTLSANLWTNGSLTFSQALPAGRYALVGARFQSAGLIAFRFVHQDGIWRPGAIGFDADGDLDAPRFRYGRAGQWFQFEHDVPPTVDFLSISADTSQVGHLDLVQVRSGPR